MFWDAMWLFESRRERKEYDELGRTIAYVSEKMSRADQNEGGRRYQLDEIPTQHQLQLCRRYPSFIQIGVGSDSEEVK
jgi:hypothetical protein